MGLTIALCGRQQPASADAANRSSHATCPRRITGILTPNITPVDANGHVDEERLRGYVDWLIERGVDGLYPNGSTGEFVRFTREERRRIVQIVVEQTHGRVPVLAGAAEANVKETIDACEDYGEMGVRAVAIVAPFYYRLSSEGVYAYFREIADTCLGRRHGVQHSAVRLADRCANRDPPGIGVPARDGHQGQQRRSARTCCG